MDVKRTFICAAGVVLLAGGIFAADPNKAPDFTLPDIDGNSVSLSDYKDKVVVLEWVNYDCPFVKAHYNENTHTMTDLATRYAERGVVWLTINSTHYATPESIREWAQEQQVKNQTVLVDTDGKVGRKYDAKTTPHMFIIDKDGTIVYEGAIDNAPLGRANGETVNYVDQALTQLLAGEAITVPETKPYGCTVKYPPQENTENG